MLQSQLTREKLSDAEQDNHIYSHSPPLHRGIKCTKAGGNHLHQLTGCLVLFRISSGRTESRINCSKQTINDNTCSDNTYLTGAAAKIIRHNFLLFYFFLHNMK